MKHAWDVKITVGFGIIIFLFLAYLKGPDFSKEIMGILSTTISVTFIARLIFIKWVWKWLPFLEWFHGIPKIEGKWSGTFKSTWRPSPDSPFATGPIDVKITQPDIYHITVTQKSGESLSHSYGENFERLNDGSILLNFSYENVPNADVREKSQISFGSSRYILDRNGILKLSGDYWTDRRSTGTVSVLKTSKANPIATFFRKYF